MNSLTLFVDGFSFHRPPASGFDRIIHLRHETYRLPQRRDHLPVVDSLLSGQFPLAAVFQPFLADLIPADAEFPHLRRDASKVRFGIDIHFAIVILGIAFGDYYRP